MSGPRQPERRGDPARGRLLPCAGDDRGNGPHPQASRHAAPATLAGASAAAAERPPAADARARLASGIALASAIGLGLTMIASASAARMAWPRTPATHAQAWAAAHAYDPPRAKGGTEPAWEADGP